MNPLGDFIEIFSRHGVDARYLPRAALYFFKGMAWEPFRIGEALAARFEREPRKIPCPPVFVLGYYRSGTTHLQQALMQDRRFGYMNFYQGFFPTAFSSTEFFVKPVFERIVRRWGMVHPSHKTPFTFEMPAEEDVSMVASGFRLAANWGQVYPRAFKELFGKAALLDGATQDEREALKAHLFDLYWRVSKANSHRPLILKSPPQLGRVALLREMFPDAKFVFIRRNPYDVFASNKKLWKTFEDLWVQKIDELTVREWILWSHDRCHQSYERDRAAIPPGHLTEVSFESFRKRPMETMEQIYDQLQLGGFDEVQPALNTYFEREHIPSQPAYFLTQEEREAVASRLRRWLDAWGYPTKAAA